MQHSTAPQTSTAPQSLLHCTAREIAHLFELSNLEPAFQLLLALGHLVCIRTCFAVRVTQLSFRLHCTGAQTVKASNHTAQHNYVQPPLISAEQQFSLLFEEWVALGLSAGLFLKQDFSRFLTV